MGMVEFAVVACPTIGMFVIVMATGVGQYPPTELLMWAVGFAGAAFLLSLVIIRIGGTLHD